MWECYNCAFMNVDTAPVCARCRARKPAYGEKIQRRSYHAQETASKERAAHEVMDNMIPPPPPMHDLHEKWTELIGDNEEACKAFAELEMRQYNTRDALRTLISIIKNPQMKGRNELLQEMVQRLIDWDK